MQISGGERALGILSYLGPLFFVPLKAKKDSIFLQFHARQGGVLFMLWAALFLIVVIALIFVGAGVFGTVLLAILFIATGLYLLLALLAIIKVVMGERYRMPVVADVALMMGL